MSQWLIDTLVWTGAAMLLVLALRRPVSRYFGPSVAYALWALPLARLVLPPFVLPARFAPATAEAQPVLAIITQAEHGSSVQGALSAFPWVETAFAIWLGGAAVFLAFRVRQYRTMRRDLLADARPVGEAGKVRLVETAAVDAPVAFGVRDKVVALPLLFMAHPDIAARDLAIAHELAHHRGHDLLANIAAQPLLALHWFNPIAWAAWRAMRRDQEAACDARVVAGLARAQRATYASVIAGFATSKHLALAAPMACPVLGEKSIIHRLRTLTMADVSSARRKIGIAAITTTALVALPMTASISYAQAEKVTVQALSSTTTSVTTVTDIDGGRPSREHLESRDTQTAAVNVDTGELLGVDAVKSVDQALAEAARATAEIDQRMADGRAAAAAAQNIAYGSNARQMQVALQCDGSSPIQQRTTADGRQLTIICRRPGAGGAIEGLRQAKASIRDADGIADQQRQQIIAEIDGEIARIQGEEMAISVILPIAPGASTELAVRPVVSVRWTPATPQTPMPVSAVYVVAPQAPATSDDI